ncbi:DUF551 domain-containing protein [Escherichia coli]|uniref:DUF551 domain-containing protein n=1 Tax=Escherichia coli TaxID=562 RepID=UPI0010CC9998|nr:DUF551 domain-containing protein [Escherichia coli]GDL62918.1 putative phage protein [Escherichia coli]GDO56258.1 putative phage protein [Escherichia coli]
MTTFTNSKLTDEYVSNATLIRLILWADQHNSHYVVAALRELQERRKADSVPVEINDDMAYAFHHALSDSSLGSDEIEEIKTGLRAAFANVSFPVTADGWISCSDAVPAEYCDVILLDDLGNVFPGSWDKVFCPTRGGNKMAFVDKDGVEVESSTHWMPLPEPPREVNQ